ncbi:type IV pilus twitching motility protein PilT [Cupriavidus ulmosensis]
MTEFCEPTQWGDKADLAALLFEVVKRGASDVVFQTGNPIVCKLDGSHEQLTTQRLTNHDVMSVLDFACGGGTQASKVEQGEEVATSYSVLDPTERDRSGEKKRHRFRVNAVKGELRNTKSVQIVMRAIPGEPMTIAQVRLEPELVAAMACESGCVWVTGATGSGKSTTLSAQIRHMLETDHPLVHGNFHTLEKPIEAVFDNIVSRHSVVHQIEVGRDIPTFGQGVRALMRMDPSCIMVGETRDEETGSACMEASNTGHLTMSSLHTNECATIPARLLSFYPPAQRATMMFDIIDTARVLINQRMVLHKSGRGRVALREFLILDEAMREEIIRKADPARLTDVVRAMLREHGRTFLASAERAYDADLISVQTLDDVRRQYGR